MDNKELALIIVSYIKALTNNIVEIKNKWNLRSPKRPLLKSKYFYHKGVWIVPNLV